MSYFAFGTIAGSERTHEAIGTRADLAWKIVEAGRELRLHVMLSPNIPQRIVNEMLDQQPEMPESTFRFLITASPICDTSDSLISPPYFGEPDLRSVHENLYLFAEWTKRLFVSGDVAEVHLYFSEGYDDDFDVMSIGAAESYRAMYAQVEKYSDIAPLALFMRRE